MAAAATQNCNQQLIFPEGTRTQAQPINDFKAGFALIAKKAGVPVQTAFIKTNIPFLSKNRPLLKKPDFQIYYQVCLGQRFEVIGHVKAFASELKRYYIQHFELQNHYQTESNPLKITLNT